MKRRLLTKEDLQFIVDNWEKYSVKEVAEKLGMTSATVTSHVLTLRKLGVNIPRKSAPSTKNLLLEFASDWKEKHK